VKRDDGQQISSCKRSELYIAADRNCPPEYKKMLAKRRADQELLALMNVPIKRERRSPDGDE
jgi:hypothetical protein